MHINTKYKHFINTACVSKMFEFCIFRSQNANSAESAQRATVGVSVPQVNLSNDQSM